jgi:hypothetical protein
MLNVIPGEPGPAFRDPNSRLDIPRCTINHGLTDKQTTFPSAYIGNGVGYNNILFACGTAMFRGSWEQYTRKWPEIIHSLKIIFVGSPKTDVLFDRTYERDAVLQQYHLDPALPTIIYAPTYQMEASLEQSGREIISALATLPINLFVRPHHLSQTMKWMTNLKSLMTEYANLRIVVSSSNPIFVAADLLVGDASGASFEFILQDKPVVFFDVPDFFAAHGKAGVGFWGREAGTVVANTKDLRQAVTKELVSPNRMSLKRKNLIEQLVFQTGNASARTVEALLDAIEGRIDYSQWGPRQCLRQDVLLHAYMRERLERCALHAKTVALFGAGKHTPKLLHFMRNAADDGYIMPKVSYIFDDCANELGESIEGIPVVPPRKKLSDEFRAIILSTDYHQATMRKRCEEVYGSEIPIVDLYELFSWHKPDGIYNKTP